MADDFIKADDFIIARSERSVNASGGRGIGKDCIFSRATSRGGLPLILALSSAQKGRLEILKRLDI